MPTDFFVDFHIHPTLKASLCLNPDNKNAINPIQLNPTGALKPIVKGFKPMLESQSNIRVMKSGKVKVGIIAFHAVEEAFADRLIFRFLVPLFTHVNKLNINAVGRFRSDFTYIDAFNNDVSCLLRTLVDEPRIKYLRSSSELTDDSTELFLIPSFEGFHCFKNYKVSDSEGEETTPTVAQQQQIISSFKQFRKDHNPFYATFTHHSRQPFCTSTYGVRVKKGPLVLLGGNKKFKPIGKGITKFGYELLETLYTPDSADRFPTLVDIKHMSLVSRLQYYEWRKKDPKRMAVPILGSHMAVTGLEYKKMRVEKIKRPLKVLGTKKTIRLRQFIKQGIIPNTYYNPWTINLFDEEIVEILKSDGFVALSLDKRVIGAGVTLQEYFSYEEYKYLRDDLNYFTEENDKSRHTLADEEAGGNLFGDDDDKDDDHDIPENETIEPDKISGKLYAQYFLNQVLHIVRVGMDNGFNGTNGKPNVWDKIGIGSDLDGLVDPILIDEKPGTAAVSFRADLFPKFKEIFKTELKSFFDDPKFANINKNKPASYDNAVDNICYHNGLDFIKKHHSPNYKPNGAAQPIAAGANTGKRG